MKTIGWKRGLACVLALLMVLCLGLTGCGKNTSADVSDVSAQKKTTAKTATETTVDPATLNPLTGLDDMNGEKGARMVGVVLGNNWRSRPQVGLEKADMYLEMETEGGITRLLAVFASAKRLPDAIGPIRSARTPSVKMGKALDVVYCHAGGSTTGKAKIVDLNVADLDGLSNGAFWRDKALMNEKGMEYSMMTGSKEVIKAIENKEYRTESQTSVPFVFGDKTGDQPGSKATIKFSGYQTVTFAYDEDTKEYTKSNLVEGEYETHVSASGEALKVSNIVILYAPKVMENSTTCDFELDEGNGILVSGGKSRSMSYTWSPDALSFTETDGTPLQVATGKTYICVVSTSLKEDTVIK